MTQRRAISGLKTRPPLRDDAQYRAALAELHALGQAALGTPATRGLQALVDCILDYEASQAALPSGLPSTLCPKAVSGPRDGPGSSGRLE